MTTAGQRCSANSLGFLDGIDRLQVRQRKEWGEILTSFETRNRYAITDASGAELAFAGEEAGSFLLRNFLKASRPFTIRIVDAEGGEILRVRRPFTFYFHRVEISTGDGRLLGTVRRRFSLLRRVYDVEAAAGWQLFGPLLKPWTFLLRDGDGRERGRIVKRWSGMLKEAFTDADNFGIELPVDADPETKAVLLGAVFLIDFVHFQKRD